MDANRFDALTRLFASRRLSRRAALAGAVGLMAAAGLRRDASAQLSQVQCGNKMCGSNPGVCTNGCVCCVYSNGNSRCRPPGTCAPGNVACPPGQVLGPSGVCAAPTTSTTTTPAPTTTTSTTTTTTTPRPIGTCSGMADGAECGDGGIGSCDDGRCFRIAPFCSPCGDNASAIPAADLAAGILFCMPLVSSIHPTLCASSQDCPSGQSCAGPFSGDGQKHCADACPA